MPVSIKLYSGKEDRFEEIKVDFAEEIGYAPTNPEVVGMLMARFDDPVSQFSNGRRR